MNGALRRMLSLRRLNLAYCNLRSHVAELLKDIVAPLFYLDLRDCRLMEEDMFFIVNWQSILSLRELNLSHNNLRYLDQVLFLLLEKMSHITCFSISYCSLSVQSQILIAQECKECSYMKILCMQNFTPLSRNDVHAILHICSQIATLQKCVVLPESYAFPGNNDSARLLNKLRMVNYCYKYLASKSRPDLLLD